MSTLPNYAEIRVSYFVKIVSAQTTDNLQITKIIQPAYCKLSFTKKPFRHSDILWWNDLPDEVALSSNYFLVHDFMLCNYM